MYLTLSYIGIISPADATVHLCESNDLNKIPELLL